MLWVMLLVTGVVSSTLGCRHRPVEPRPRSGLGVHRGVSLGPSGGVPCGMVPTPGGHEEFGMVPVIVCARAGIGLRALPLLTAVGGDSAYPQVSGDHRRDLLPRSESCNHLARRREN